MSSSPTHSVTLPPSSCVRRSTPSEARIILADAPTKQALGSLDRMLVGGACWRSRDVWDCSCLEVTQCGEGSLAARARLGIARVHLLRGEPAGTLGEVEKARDVAQSHQDAALEVQSLLALARMHLFLGQAKRGPGRVYRQNTLCLGRQGRQTEPTDMGEDIEHTRTLG